jgi:hypothetical protein
MGGPANSVWGTVNAARHHSLMVFSYLFHTLFSKMPSFIHRSLLKFLNLFPTEHPHP